MFHSCITSMLKKLTDNFILQTEKYSFTELPHVDTSQIEKCLF